MGWLFGPVFHRASVMRRSKSAARSGSVHQPLPSSSGLGFVNPVACRGRVAALRNRKLFPMSVPSSHHLSYFFFQLRAAQRYLNSSKRIGWRLSRYEKNSHATDQAHQALQNQNA
jgi:hypothetical protein